MSSRMRISRYTESSLHESVCWLYRQVMRIRVATADDAAALLDIYAPYVRNTAITFEYEVPSAEEFRHRMEKTLSRYPYLIAEEDGCIVGYAYAGHFTSSRPAYDHSAEVSIYISQEHRGKGTGRLLYESLEKLLALQGVCSLYSCIALPRGEDPYLDDSSYSFHEHMGYTLCGRFDSCGYKFSRWYDMVWMGKNIAVHDSGVLPFKSFNDIPVNSILN